ncbi:hypothetical protein JVU11DRAFT_7188 [Chiua virens]|nr:hypothetical protein JVU11DRAFT_7188 [Chiua virens]
MSDNVTSSAGLVLPTNAMILPSVNSLMVSHTFLSLLIPLTTWLFYLSTPENRRRPVFLLNLGAIVFAFVICILVDASAIHTILHPLRPWHLHLVIQFIAVWQSILVDLTLLVRLISVYPPQQVGPIRFALLTSIPVLLKLARTVNLLLFTKVMVDTLYGPNAAMADVVFISKPYIKIEWGTQMMDNTYVSLASLWKIGATIAQRMRTIFRIALTNFVIPTVFSIAQFVSLYHGAGMTVLNQLVFINMMLSTFGVVLATIWASSITRQEGQTGVGRAGVMGQHSR